MATATARKGIFGVLAGPYADARGYGAPLCWDESHPVSLRSVWRETAAAKGGQPAQGKHVEIYACDRCWPDTERRDGR